MGAFASHWRGIPLLGAKLMSSEKEVISREEVLLTAELSQISLEEHEIPGILKALGVILEHFEAFSSINLEQGKQKSPVENHVSLEDCRADIPIPGNRERISEIAPDFEDDFFFVPRVK